MKAAGGLTKGQDFLIDMGGLLVVATFLVGCASVEHERSVVEDTAQKVPAHQVRDTIGHKILELEEAVLGSKNGPEKLDQIILESTNEISRAKISEITEEETRALKTFEAIARALNRNGYRHAGTYPNSLTAVLAASPPRATVKSGVCRALIKRHSC